MPYICLARSDIPSGTVQILDLWPNSSLRLPPYDPPGQTRYLKRPTSDSVNFNPNGTLERDVWGMAAYLIDHVEVGGLTQADLTVTATGVLGGDTVTVKGVVFTAAGAGANPALQQFDESAGDANTATTLAATITNAASIALMKASGTPALAYAGATPALNVVTLDALTGAAVPLLGGAGDLPVTTSNAVRLALNTPLNRLFRATERWGVSSLNTTVAALLARVDGGLALALANINTAIAAGAAGSELTNAGGSGSTGTVADVLSIMAGRQYFLPMRNPITGVMNQIMNGGTWDSSGFGGFTTPVLVNGDVMAHGEWKPANIGGDTENRPVGPYRHTYDGGAFQKSLLNGHLAVFAGVAGMTPVTLFTNNSPTPLFPWDFQAAVQYPQVTGARVVTVYDDAGAVLA